MHISDTAEPVDLSEADYAVKASDQSFWESRTADQLREMLDRGLAGGDAFSGAAIEIERRAGETARRAREFSSGDYGRRDRRLQLAKLATLAVAAAITGALALYWLAY